VAGLIIMQQPDARAIERDYACTPKRLIPLCHWRALDRKGMARGKTPRERDWTKDEYPFGDMVTWMERGNNCGFRLGDGFGVLDADPRRDPAVMKLKAEGKSLEEALREAAGTLSIDRLLRDIGVKKEACFGGDTGGRGEHIYLRIPKDFRGREQVPEYPGVEFKHGQRRYVVAMGSIHPGDAKQGIPEGRPYVRWEGSPPLDQTVEIADGHKLLDIFKHVEPPPNERGSGPESFGNFAGRLPEFLSRVPVERVRSGSDPSFEQVMMACHWASGGVDREEFVEWCISDPNYSDHGDIIRKRWDSLTPRADGLKTGLLFKMLDREGVPKTEWPSESASVMFDGEVMSMEEIEGVGVGATEPLPPGVQELGKALSMSFDALDARIGDLPPFLDGFLYGNHGGVYVIYGEPKSGKSLVVYSLSLAVANGDPEWMGKRLWLHGPVRWFALESPHSLIMSGKAWKKRTGKAHPDIRFTFNGQGFTDPKWMDELEMLCKGCRLAVIDTFTMALPGQDQNSPEAASMLFSKLNEVGRRTGTTFIVIHHSTKADGRNARGSNAIIGNSDGSVAVLKAGAGEITVEAQAVRYGPDGGELSVQIEQEVLGSDPQRDGQTMTGPFLVLAHRRDDDDQAPASPLDEVARFVAIHGKFRGGARVLSRASLRDDFGLEDKPVRSLYEGWSETFQGKGYTLDLAKIAKRNGQEIIIRFSDGNPWSKHLASVMFTDSLLSPDELSDHAGLV